jgi:ferredoxin-NADP reductase
VDPEGAFGIRRFKEGTMSVAMSTRTALLQQREEIAEGTMAFHLEKPTGFEFSAGQSIDLTLVNPREGDSEGNSRAFSIASAPYEGEILVATRMRDTAFKRVLGTLPVGSSVKVDGPFGYFKLHRNPTRSAVFLAGGIGITPFLSMVRQAAHDQLPQQLYLFYSNRRPEDAPFLDALFQLTKTNSRFHFIPCMSQMERSHRQWTAETGSINRKMLDRYLPALAEPVYYVAGPPAMVATIRQMLTAAGVDEDNVRTEEFSGY